MHKLTPNRTAAAALVEQLVINGVEHVFCVPGESFLPVLDELRDSGITVTVCRHEGGAAMMAEAVGKTTGRPGICFVTRGPGATNASAGFCPRRVWASTWCCAPLLLRSHFFSHPFSVRDWSGPAVVRYATVGLAPGASLGVLRLAVVVGPRGGAGGQRV